MWGIHSKYPVPVQTRQRPFRAAAVDDTQGLHKSEVKPYLSPSVGASVMDGRVNQTSWFKTQPLLEDLTYGK